MELHCVICYEEFDLNDRKPVVLPCGHTYLCEVCAKRIKICHQCREPLYWNPPKQTQPQHMMNNHQHNIHRSPATSRYSRYNNHSRYSPSTPPHLGGGLGTNKPPEKREKVRLPCPENQVLMEMIEAKQRQERLVAEQKEQKLQRKQEKILLKQRLAQQRKEEKEKLRLLRRRHQQEQQFQSEQQIEVDIDQQKNSDGNTNSNSNSGNSGNNLLDTTEEDYDDYDNETDCDDDEHDDYDDELSSSTSSSGALPLGDPQLNSGYAALSGTCGTYAVTEPEGLVVLPRDPNRLKYQQSNTTTRTRTQQHHQQRHQQYNGDEKKEGSQHSSSNFSSIFNHNLPSDEQDSNINGVVDSGDTTTTTTTIRSSQSRREPFSISEGSKIQVVGVLESNDHGVYQLARGAGFVVATEKQLVKVGGPLETSCKMEGMLQSILEKQQEMQRKLDEMANLAIGLKQKIILEQSNPEEFPVISIPIPSEEGEGLSPAAAATNDSSNNAAATVSTNSSSSSMHPKTPERATHSQLQPGVSPIGGSAGQSTVVSVDSTHVELGTTPRTPMQRPMYYTDGQQAEYPHSPAHSCPIPSNTRTTSVHLDQPFLDDAPRSTGILRYRVNNDDDTSGLGWAGVLGCGTSFFGERLLESSESGAANSIFNTTANSFSQNALMQQTNVQRRADALAVVAAGGVSSTSAGSYRIGLLESSGSAYPPLRRGGSFDGAVNFRMGYSHHNGLGKTKRDFSCDQQLSVYQNGEAARLRQNPRQRSKMSQMSQHRGAAPLRLGPRADSLLQRRGGSADTLVGCQTSAL